MRWVFPAAARWRAAWLALALALATSAVRADGTPAPSITLDEYRARLQALLAATQDPDQPRALAAATSRLPHAWSVAAGTQQFLVPTDWLRVDLDELRFKPTAELRTRVEARLGQLIADLDAYQAPPPDRSRDRRTLASILARSEFSGVHRPTWLARLRRQIAELLLRLLQSIFGSSAFPVVTKLVVFGLVGLAILVTALWVYRTLAGGQAPQVALSSLPVSAKPWTVWLNEAREAAAAGRWRDAVRLAYWAGIACLESRGVWPPDRARTPREYLRLLPASSEHRPALSALTRTFEPVWYGDRPADAGTFDGALGDLERLGATVPGSQQKLGSAAPGEEERCPSS